VIGDAVLGWRLLLFVALRRTALRSAVVTAGLIATLVWPPLLVGAPVLSWRSAGPALPGRLPGIPVAVAVAAAGQLLLTTFSDSGVLTLDGASGRVLGGAELTAGAMGGRTALAFNPATGRIYVTDGQAIDVLAADTSALRAPITLEQDPTDIAVNPATDRVYIATRAGRGRDAALLVLDGDRNTILATMPIGPGPLRLSVDPAANRVYVVDTGNGSLVVLDGATDAVLARLPVGPGPHELAVDARTGRVYVSNGDGGSVSVLDGATRRVLATVAVGGRPGALAVNERRHRVYVACGAGAVIVLDAATDRVLTTVAMGQRPAALAVDAATDRVYVADTIDNSVWLLQDRRRGSPTARVIAHVGKADAGVSSGAR
jgi:YVTN family beta-propeller protein